MEKIKISNNAFIYPMPMVLVGSTVKDQPNFMPVAWISRANADPPMLSIALGKNHQTTKSILINEVFSVNIPNETMVEQTDYCGLVSGSTTDKSKVFKVFKGDHKDAPMIEACPLAMECKVFATYDLPSNILIVGQIVAAYTEGKYLTEGKVDITKIKPFTLTMPDNNYWTIGSHLAKAWSVGKKLK